MLDELHETGFQFVALEWVLEAEGSFLNPRKGEICEESIRALIENVGKPTCKYLNSIADRKIKIYFEAFYVVI